MTEPCSITVEIPEFSQMSDDEVTQHVLARVLDGRWSPVTRDLLARFGTDKLDLNESWANTWQHWQCPCCLRLKADIARLSTDRVLLCKIDLHHDHLVDLAKQMFRATADETLSEETRRMRTRARSAAFGLIERFTPTLLCEDCNHADGDMKAALGQEIPPHFSFSPAEIARFVKPKPNASHDIDNSIGREIWTQVRSAFEDRVAFTQVLVERIQAGRQDIEVGAHPFGLHRTEASMLYDLALRSTSRRSPLGTMFKGLLARSRATDGIRSNAGKPNRRRVVVPSDREFAAVELRNAGSKPSTRAGEAWRCGICDRSKFEICRKSIKGKWAASVQYLCSFTDEAVPENQARRAQVYGGAILLRSHRRYAVCQDCRHIVTAAVKAVPGTDEHCLRPEDLRALIGAPVAHSMHAVEISAIKDAVWANTEWIDATRDYWAHRSEALNIYSSVRILATQGHVVRQAERLVIDDYLARQQGAQADYSRAIWLLKEGARYATEDRKTPLI